MSSATRNAPVKAILVATTVGIILGSGGCARVQKIVTKTPGATAALLPTKGHEVRGAVHFTQRDGAVVVTGHLTGLTPGAHGLHIHEKGNCTASDASSAGAHYNPYNAPHAGPRSEAHHGGDLGNIIANVDGDAEFTIEVVGITVGPVGNSVIGRSVVVHADADDLVTQPAGNSGARLACGLISRNP